VFGAAQTQSFHDTHATLLQATDAHDALASRVLSQRHDADALATTVHGLETRLKEAHQAGNRAEAEQQVLCSRMDDTDHCLKRTPTHAAAARIACLRRTARRSLTDSGVAWAGSCVYLIAAWKGCSTDRMPADATVSAVMEKTQKMDIARPIAVLEAFREEAAATLTELKARTGTLERVALPALHAQLLDEVAARERLEHRARYLPKE
jgi:hypothetical protein